MTLAQIFQVSRFVTNTNSVNASDTNLLRLASERHKQMVVRLANLLENYNLVQGLASLSANSETLASVPLDIIKIKRMELTYASGGTFYPVTFYDINQSKWTNDTTTINANFNTASPYAFLKGTTIQVRPVPAASVLDAAKIWYIQMPTDFAATSETPGVPAEYHRLLADLIAIDIRMMKGEINPVTALQEEDVIWKFLETQVSPRVSGQNQVAMPAYESYD